MSELKIYRDDDSNAQQHLHSATDISAALAKVGVRFEQWPTYAEIDQHASQAQILDMYKPEVAALCASEGYQTIDVISLAPEHPQKDELRKKFLDEHRHSENEVRFFIRGEGLFYLHIDAQVFAVHCVQGDLISVPAQTPHWFDMGPQPDFSCIRFFNNPSGWVAQYTGNPIANNYPRKDA